ncbi:hypothetical protein DUI87_17982 [Hirundo rustica rustica]|uniref:Uncharacterized protein n=1 Tax=Hirundo rustica rustica TaxID=333673 RepID=A0A3M0K0R3_HIRRU|nr:hypothetical protein DUI87_17982 [Hirundo rustica rustica]
MWFTGFSLQEDLRQQLQQIEMAEQQSMIQPEPVDLSLSDNSTLKRRQAYKITLVQRLVTISLWSFELCDRISLQRMKEKQPVAPGVMADVPQNNIENRETQSQVAQRNCGCPVPESVRDKVEQDFEQPDPVEGVLAEGRALELDDL